MEYEYVLKVSTRARRVNLRMTAEDGLVVTVPKRYNQKKIPEVLARHEKWLAKMHVKFKDERAKRLQEPLLPEQIELQALQQVWNVVYQQSDRTTIRTIETEDTITLNGAVCEPELCLQALHKWLKKKAKKVFPPLLQYHAERMNQNYCKLRIGNQKSRWGSCSSSKNISLNMKMLFLPPQLMNYVIIHELSHLEHMNHSKAFWQYVAQFEPDYKKLDMQLRQSWSVLPRFIL